MANINKIFGCGVCKKTTELTSEGESFICPNCQTKNIIPKDIDISEKTVKDIMQLIIAIVAICFMISMYSCTKEKIVPTHIKYKIHVYNGRTSSPDNRSYIINSCVYIKKTTDYRVLNELQTLDMPGHTYYADFFINDSSSIQPNLTTQKFTYDTCIRFGQDGICQITLKYLTEGAHIITFGDTTQIPKFTVFKHNYPPITAINNPKYIISSTGGEFIYLTGKENRYDPGLGWKDADIVTENGNHVFTESVYFDYYLESASSGTSGTNCSSRQCIGTTQAGNRCKNKTTNCDSRCYLH